MNEQRYMRQVVIYIVPRMVAVTENRNSSVEVTFDERAIESKGYRMWVGLGPVYLYNSKIVNSCC